MVTKIHHLHNLDHHTAVLIPLTIKIEGEATTGVNAGGEVSLGVTSITLGLIPSMVMTVTPRMPLLAHIGNTMIPIILIPNTTMHPLYLLAIDIPP